MLQKSNFMFFEYFTSILSTLSLKLNGTSLIIAKTVAVNLEWIYFLSPHRFQVLGSFFPSQVLKWPRESLERVKHVEGKTTDNLRMYTSWVTLVIISSHNVVAIFPAVCRWRGQSPMNTSSQGCHWISKLQYMANS